MTSKWKRVVAVTGMLTVSLLAAERESLEQLQERAARAKPAEQVKLYMELAERQLHAAAEAFNDGQVERGNTFVNEMAEACEKAQAAARATGKHQKPAEIQMRTLERRLDGIRRSLNYDDREVVSRAIDRLEKARSDLLSDMFGITP